MNENHTDQTSHGPAAFVSRRAALLTGIGAATALLTSSAGAEDVNPELDEVRTLLKAHDEALKSQDVDAVLKTFATKSAVLGSGPGEIWSGHEEIKAAYEHFFKGFDKGAQEFDYHFKLGGLNAASGWLVTSGNIKGKKEGKAFEFPINLSLAVTKTDGKWLISALHFSTLTGAAGKGE